MTETSNCDDDDGAENDGADDADADALQIELMPQPLTIMKARW